MNTYIERLYMYQSDDPLANEVRALSVTRKELSLLTGIAYNTISHWLNGFSNLTPINREKIENGIKVCNGTMNKATFEKKYNRITNLTFY